MRKLFIALALMGANYSFGQLSMGNYIVKIQTGQAYSPLTTGTNLTSGIIWDEENFKVPMGFSVNIDGKSSADFSSLSGVLFGASSDTSGVINSIIPFGASDLIDRGSIAGTPKSPIRYQLTGSTPNRIFKFEVFNAGFYDEEDIHSTLNDSVNFQIWVYETSSIIELRYGSSRITYPSDYFYAGASPMIGYVKNFNIDDFTLTRGYTLKGSPTTPVVDSFTSFMTDPPVMSAYPPNGTVYRFIPKAVSASVGETTIAQQLNVYPTVVKEYINVDYSESQATNAAIFSANGQLIESSPIIRGANAIDVSGLATGAYLMNISNSEGKASFKFIKQ